jgi:hypothetical protein
VTRAYEDMPEHDREVLAGLIKNPYYSGGFIADLIRREYPTHTVDHHAVDHFRRKLKVGKATL